MHDWKSKAGLQTISGPFTDQRILRSFWALYKDRL